MTGTELEGLAIEEIAASPAAARTNYFGQPLPDDCIVMRGGETLLILASERGVCRLYYVTRNVAEWRELVRQLPRDQEIVVADVHRDVEPPFAAELAADDFAFLTSYARMTNRDLSVDTAKNDADFARPDEAETLHSLLLTGFDPRTDHLPSSDTVAQRVAANEVLVARLHDQICGFVLFHIDGRVAHFNYLYSHCGDREATAAMIRHFYEAARNAGATQAVLWCDERKTRVIALYEAFGWRRDGRRTSYYTRPAESC